MDPITQLMVYYRRGDGKSFVDPQFTKVQRFLSLFLLGKKDKIMDYLPNDAYLPFVDILSGNEINQVILNWM